jgi:hypothetical protein
MAENTNTERAKFESAVKSLVAELGETPEDRDFVRDSSGEYEDGFMEIAWSLWQARASLPAAGQEPVAPHGWLYDWTHSSAIGKPDAMYTGFTKDEQHARKHDNCIAVYTAQQPAPSAAAAEGWKLVPVKETQEMLTAVYNMVRPGTWLEVAQTVWRTMVEAAPQPSPTPQADSQPAHQWDTGYPPLPRPDACDGASGTVGWSERAMRGFVDADRAARAPADSVQDLQPVHDAVTIDLLNERVAYLESKLKAADSVLEDAARLDWLLGKGRCMGIDSFGGQYRVVDTSCSLVVTDWMPTQRAAIDAARKQGANHD